MTCRQHAEHAELRAAIVAATAARHWTPKDLARNAGVSWATANSLLRSKRTAQAATLRKAADALGVEVDDERILPPDDPRDTSAIGRACACDVDLPALRYVLRQLVDEARCTCQGRALLVEAGRLAGLPDGWENLPLMLFEA